MKEADMETRIIDATAETQIIMEGTQLVSGSTTETGANFTGGLLQIGEHVSGWQVNDMLATVSGEADIYIAEKDGKPGVIKYYRSVTQPKTGILEKLKGLHHPGIVDVYDFGTYNDRFYEIMEYAEGGALDTRKDNEKHSYRYLPLSEEEAAGICKEVINSFKICHEMGIIHRDIKPSNIYFRHVEVIEETCEVVEETGTVAEDGKIRKRYKGSDAVIADFGISSIMDEAEQLHKTRTGSRTTGYAAPEVLTGLISPKMDYYALGITLWELLTGKDPFTMENGKRRNDAHLIRDTIEGRIADDILSKEPKVSQNMERLIRGLLVIDPEHRWGYDEVMRHLAGETVEVYQRAKKSWIFSIGETECTTLEDLGSALMDNIEAAKKYIFRHRLGAFLEDDYPGISKKIEEIAEESSAKKDENNGILKVAYLLNPGIPFKVDNGFKAQNLDDIIFLLENAPESLLHLFRDHRSGLYTWFEIIGNTDLAEEIKKIPENISDTEFAGKAEVLLKNRVIKPFKLEKYKDFELSTLDQLRKVPGDMQRHILALVKEKSYEGLFLPWLYTAAPNVSVDNIDTSSWGKFIVCIT
jgi:serine/threonine protein kinase